MSPIVRLNSCYNFESVRSFLVVLQLSIKLLLLRVLGVLSTAESDNFGRSDIVLVVGLRLQALKVFQPHYEMISIGYIGEIASFSLRLVVTWSQFAICVLGVVVDGL